jgi:hypothetical protein
VQQQEDNILPIIFSVQFILILWHSSVIYREKITIVSLYYKERQFVTSHRGELYGPADFLGKNQTNVMDKVSVFLCLNTTL